MRSATKACPTTGKPIAYHMFYDPGGTTIDGETAVYARRDLVSGRSLVVLLGREGGFDSWNAETPYQRVVRLLRDRPDAHISTSCSLCTRCSGIA